MGKRYIINCLNRLSVILIRKEVRYDQGGQTGRGEVTISNAVFTAITGAAATNCFGVKGMAYRSMTDGLVRLLRREAMSKGVKVTYNDDNTVSIELHIVVENGVNIASGLPLHHERGQICGHQEHRRGGSRRQRLRGLDHCLSAPHRRRNRTMTQRISGGVFKQMIVFGAACITQQKQADQRPERIPRPGRRHRHQHEPDHRRPPSAELQQAPSPTSIVEAGRPDHRLRPAARRAAATPASSCPCCSAASAKAIKDRRDADGRRAGHRPGVGRGRRLQGGDEARRGHRPDRLPPGGRAGALERRTVRTTDPEDVLTEAAIARWAMDALENTIES